MLGDWSTTAQSPNSKRFGKLALKQGWWAGTPLSMHSSLRNRNIQGEKTHFMTNWRLGPVARQQQLLGRWDQVKRFKFTQNVWSPTSSQIVLAKTICRAWEAILVAGGLSSMGEVLGSIPSIGRGVEIQNLAAEKKKWTAEERKKKLQKFLLWEKKSGSSFQRLCCVANHHWRAVGF